MLGIGGRHSLALGGQAGGPARSPTLPGANRIIHDSPCAIQGAQNGHAKSGYFATTRGRKNHYCVNARDGLWEGSHSLG